MAGIVYLLCICEHMEISGGVIGIPGLDYNTIGYASMCGQVYVQTCMYPIHN